MFDLVEAPVATRTRTRLTTAVSYSLQLAAIAALFSIPLLHNQAISLEQHHLLPPYRYEPEHVQVVSAQPTRPLRNTAQIPINPLIPPQHIPATIDRRPDPPSTGPATDPACLACVPIAGSPDGVRNAVIDSMMRTPPTPALHRAAPSVIRTSKAQESLLLRQVKPVYPRLAIEAHVQGDVVLQATISREGSIRGLRVVSGPPLLINSALDAVRQWVYRPYFLNGEAVEVETQITVHFTFGHS